MKVEGVTHRLTPFFTGRYSVRKIERKKERKKRRSGGVQTTTAAKA